MLRFSLQQESSETSDTLSDTGNQRLLPADGEPRSPPTLRNRTADPGLTARILLYLVSVGLVATATIWVFSSVGSFSLGYPAQKAIRTAAVRDRGAEAELMRDSVLPQAKSAAAAAPAESEAPRSAALPPPAQGAPANDVRPPATSAAPGGSVPMSPVADGGAAKEASPSGKAPTLNSPALDATGASPVPAAAAVEPSPRSPPSPASAAPASPRHVTANLEKRWGAQRPARSLAGEGITFEQHRDFSMRDSRPRQGRLERQKAYSMPAAIPAVDPEEAAWRDKLREWREKLRVFWQATGR